MIAGWRTFLFARICCSGWLVWVIAKRTVTVNSYCLVQGVELTVSPVEEPVVMLSQHINTVHLDRGRKGVESEMESCVSIVCMYTYLHIALSPGLRCLYQRAEGQGDEANLHVYTKSHSFCTVKVGVVIKTQS